MESERVFFVAQLFFSRSKVVVLYGFNWKFLRSQTKIGEIIQFGTEVHLEI